MCQPEGFGNGSDNVAMLQQGLYGIKQGAYLWNKHMHQKLTSKGFVRTTSDPAVYTRCTATGNSITTIYVNNALTVTDTKTMLKETQKTLHSLFEMKEEDPDWLMGFKLTDDHKNRTVTLLQAQYIDTLLQHHWMDTCTPISMLMEKDATLSKVDCPQNDTEKQEMTKYPYHKILSSITWLTVVS